MKKIDLSFFRKNKREFLFGLIGFFLSLFLFFLFLNSIDFLIEKINIALEFKDRKSNFVRFNLESLRDLGLLNQEDK